MIFPYGALTLMQIQDIFDHQMKLSEFTRLRAKVATYDQATPLSNGLRQDAGETLDEFRVECQRLQLNGCWQLIHYTTSHMVTNEKTTVAELAHRLNDIDYLFRTLCSEQIFFRLNREESEMFSSTKPFGPEVTQAFPSDDASYECTEAAKSYALGCYTASVFHLMRFLEKGLKALAGALNVQFSIPFDYQNWQNIIDQIEAEIRKVEQQKAGQLKTDTLKAYSEVAKQFRYFKDAWRNSVAHSRETYSPEQALSIYRHVREFMCDIVKLGLKE